MSSTSRSARRRSLSLRQRASLSLRDSIKRKVGVVAPLWLASCALPEDDDERLIGQVPYLVAKSGLGEALLLERSPASLDVTLAPPAHAEHARWFDSLGMRFLWSGPWDRSTVPTESHEVERWMRELFEGGRPRPFRETRAYQEVLDLLAAGTPVRRARGRYLDTRERVDRYFEERLALFERMRAEGFRTQRSLGRPTGEIDVAITREGELVRFRDGRHRTAIARILGLPRVTVLVRVVHTGWVRTCRARYGGGLASAIRAGLEDLRSRSS